MQRPSRMKAGILGLVELARVPANLVRSTSVRRKTTWCIGQTAMDPNDMRSHVNDHINRRRVSLLM